MRFALRGDAAGRIGNKVFAVSLGNLVVANVREVNGPRPFACRHLARQIHASLLVCVPSFCFSVYIIETHISWSAPALVMGAILCIGVFNFGLTVAR